MASVMDLHSSRKMTTDIVIKALKNAYPTQNPSKKLILHTDLGSQYTSKEFQELLAERNIIQSFSKKAVLMIMLVWNHFTQL
ncbi:hypothetical protein J6TS2_39540 [Heyndrickxia sporothermodurans]|nr:hypothetical protein J6TS2_39540 [Heyndrickxia sporothermodurans]